MTIKKYVVVYESSDEPVFVNCVGIYDTAEEACGAAYFSLIDGLGNNDNHITLMDNTEGETGWVMHLEDKSGKSQGYALILFYTEDTE